MITLQVNGIIISCMYRPPRHHTSSFKHAFSVLSEVVDNSPLVVTGDFNARNEEWNTNDRTNTDGRALNSVFNDLGLSLVSKNCGTRPSSHSNPSLDLVLSNAPDVFDNCIVGMPLTDHCPVICSASWSALSAIYRSVSGATKGQTRENTTEKPEQSISTSCAQYSVLCTWKSVYLGRTCTLTTDAWHCAHR